MYNQTPESRSVLSRLRALPRGRAGYSEHATRYLAERQAALLRYLTTGIDTSIEQIIGSMPRVRVQAGEIPTSGLSHWDGRQWIITYNVFEPRTRQRFTILHEYKHIVDHPDVADLYRSRRDATASEQMEQAADYFAGCVLVPRALLVDAWNDGMTEPAALAHHFDVSVPAINVRLMQVGLRGNTKRCASPTTYARSSAHSERLAS